jgi:hypothetical protein
MQSRTRSSPRGVVPKMPVRKALRTLSISRPFASPRLRGFRSYLLVGCPMDAVADVNGWPSTRRAPIALQEASA